MWVKCITFVVSLVVLLEKHGNFMWGKSALFFNVCARSAQVD
jgi:hypothetical protein